MENVQENTAIATAEAPVMPAHELSTKEKQRAQAIDRAKNYPMFSDGLTPQPVTVGNITNYTNKAGYERTLINFNCKTERCVGGSMSDENAPANATYDQPADWKLKATTGQIVQLFIQDGRVNKIFPANALVGRVITASKPAIIAVGNDSIDGDSGEVIPTKAVVPADNDLPF